MAVASGVTIIAAATGRQLSKLRHLSKRPMKKPMDPVRTAKAITPLIYDGKTYEIDETLTAPAQRQPTFRGRGGNDAGAIPRGACETG